MSEDIHRSTLEIKIHKFISQYGPEQLIDWLDSFDYMGGPVKYRMFRKIEKIACDTFSITIADMKNISTTESTNAKRVICFVAANKINLRQPIISKLLGCASVRSVAYYIRDAEDWIKNPKSNKLFYEGYTKAINKFNLEIQ
jgi:hypothetical protein